MILDPYFLAPYFPPNVPPVAKVPTKAETPPITAPTTPNSPVGSTKFTGALRVTWSNCC